MFQLGSGYLLLEHFRQAQLSSACKCLIAMPDPHIFPTLMAMNVPSALVTQVVYVGVFVLDGV